MLLPFQAILKKEGVTSFSFHGTPKNLETPLMISPGEAIRSS